MSEWGMTASAQVPKEKRRTQGDGADTQRRCTTPGQSDLLVLSTRSRWGVEESGLHPHLHGGHRASLPCRPASWPRAQALGRNPLASERPF